MSSIFTRGIEALERLKAHTGTKKDLALALRMLSDSESIRRSLGKKDGASMEARYITEDLIDDLVEALTPEASVTEEDTDKIDPLLDHVNAQGYCPCFKGPGTEAICGKCKHYERCTAANKWRRVLTIEPLVLRD